jgi:pyruvate/2-oxoacid:ferredoxin oxidoreductase beta subunit
MIIWEFGNQKVNYGRFVFRGGIIMVRIIKMDDILARTSHHTVLYIGYDNEAFMNTGIQESGTTPYAASTTTGPGGNKIKGKIGIKEDYLPGFTLLGHKSGFFATANTSYPLDFMGKVMEALKTEGGGFIQIVAPCPRGWRHESNQSLLAGRLASESGYWPLITVRVKNGQPKYSFSRVPNQKKVEGEFISTDDEKVLEFIKLQGKFRHLIKPEFLEKHIDEIMGQVKARNANLNNLLKSMGEADPEEKYAIMPMKVANQKHLNPGHGLCPGCGAGMMLNQLSSAAATVAGDNVIYVNNTSCTEVATSKDDVTSWQVSWVHQLFESGSTVADAISTSYRIMKNKNLADSVPYVIHIGGDGSTVNIGFQFLKSSIVRSCGYQIMNPDLKI